MFSILLQAARNILNGLICVAHFSNHVNSAFHKKVHETYWYSSSKACQEKITGRILRILPFNDTNPLYLRITSTPCSFLRVKVIKE